MWDIVIQAGIGLLLGAAVGYGVAAIIEALSEKFADFWNNLVETAKSIWGYITEATQHYLALIAQYLDKNWSEIRAWLIQEFGYINGCLVWLFAENHEVFLGFADPNNIQGKSTGISLGLIKDPNVQLATSQDPLINYIGLS